MLATCLLSLARRGRTSSEGVGQPIDLAAVRAASGGVVTCYERFLAGEGIDLVQLNGALAALRRLPKLGGSVGRALTLVARGGGDASTEETIAALELLRCAPGLRTLPPVARERRAATKQPLAAQPSLPGLG